MCTACLAVACGTGVMRPESSKDLKVGREQGVYKIRVHGRDVGSEKYALEVTATGASSRSVLEYQNPTGKPQRLQFDSQLEMEPGFRPRSYRLNTMVDGQRGFLQATISPNQVMFDYGGRAKPYRSGVLVGKDYTVLDTNIFHHFIFLARLYDFESDEKVQRFEVVIPQESESGFLKVSEVGKESVSTGRKKHDTRRLKIDSGAKVIDVWVDREGLVRKIAVEAQGIEILRDP